jgi:hypothetical protein
MDKKIKDIKKILRLNIKLANNYKEKEENKELKSLLEGLKDGYEFALFLLNDIK